MFVSDKLIYIELQKTGSSSIRRLLRELLGGKFRGHHNRASDEQIRSGAYIVSSIRNPWEWYLSLWTWGVQGGGRVMRNLTRKQYREAVAEVVRRPSLRSCSLLVNELKRNVSLWRALYSDAADVDSFRKWLRLMHDPNTSRYISRGYGKSAVKDFCGLMTWRYLRICCSQTWKLNDGEAIPDYASLLQYEQDSCYIDFFIHQERLVDDLCEAVEKVRPLSADERKRIHSAERIKRSERPLTISDYYDEETSALVGSRDRLLVEKFGYVAPVINAQEAG